VERLRHIVRIARVLLRIELVVVALHEHRPPPAGGDAAREHARDVLARPLERVLLLAARELEDHRARVEPLGRPADGPRHVEHLGAQVDRGHREATDLTPAACHVQLVDARRRRAQDL
jgi:hypothetical protein